MSTRFLINQCQIITFLILKSDIIENSRIKLRGIVLPVLQIKLKLHLLLFYPSAWSICDFFLFHIEIEGKGGWIIGGPKGMLAPLSNYWGGGGGGGLPPPPPPPRRPPLPTPMSNNCTVNFSPTPQKSTPTSKYLSFFFFFLFFLTSVSILVFLSAIGFKFQE